MKKIKLSENGYNIINKRIIEESYSDKVELVKNYLNNNFMRATFEKDGENVGIFVKLSNHLPTEKSYWKQDILDILDKEFNDLISDKKERDGLLNQIVNDWYENKKPFRERNTLSTYNF
jgi:hypothetical protein